MEKALRQAVNDACISILKEFPKDNQKLHKIIISTFERALFTVAYQFCRGHQRQLASMLGVTESKVRHTIKRHNIQWSGTYPDTYWLDLYLSLNPIPDPSSALAMHIMYNFQFAVMKEVYFYLLETNKKSMNYLYDFVRQDIEVPLIKIAYALGDGTSKQAHKILGISQVNLRAKVRKYNIKTR